MSPPSSKGTTNMESCAAGLENSWEMYEQSSKTSNEMGCSVQGKTNRPGQFRIGRQGQRARNSWNVVFIQADSSPDESLYSGERWSSEEAAHSRIG